MCLTIVQNIATPPPLSLGLEKSSLVKIIPFFREREREREWGGDRTKRNIKAKNATTNIFMEPNICTATKTPFLTPTFECDNIYIN